MDRPPIQYARTTDGFDIAYTVMGKGRPLVLMPTPFGHLGNDWNWWKKDLLEATAARFKVVHYNSRGHGMSMRGLSESFAIQDYVQDLETVVEQTGLEHYVLWGFPLFGYVGILHALKAPERVDALILHNCWAGRPWQSAESYEPMARASWDAFLYNFSAAQNVLPNRATDDAALGLDRADFLAIVRASRSAPPYEDVASKLAVPALVVVSADVPGAVESGRLLASAIPQGRLVAVPSWGQDLLATGDGPPPLVTIVEEFLAGLPTRDEATRPAASESDGQRDAGLTPRELEVLRLIGRGLSNQEIAEELVLSVRTVERHITNLYGKIGARRKAEATAYALRNGLA
jgi:DNA-binding CsgD family transcriptional regulator/pimeloyl-ACP methyl ester carboxylesterase